MQREENKEVSQRPSNNADAEAIQNYTSQKLMENHILASEGNSFDRDDPFKCKLIKKNLGIAKKGDNKIQLVNTKALMQKKTGGKFIMYKRPDIKPNTNKLVSYEQLNYTDNNYLINNTSVDASMYRKTSYQLDKKRKGKVISSQNKKAKNKRSATPSLTAPQQFIAQQFNANNILKRKNLVKLTKDKGAKFGILSDNISGLLMS